MNLSRRSFIGALFAIPFVRRFVPPPVEWQSRLWIVEPPSDRIEWTPIVDASCPPNTIYFFNLDGVWRADGSDIDRISTAITQVKI